MYFPCLVNWYGSLLHSLAVLVNYASQPRVNILNNQTEVNILNLLLVVSWLRSVLNYALVSLIGVFLCPLCSCPAVALLWGRPWEKEQIWCHIPVTGHFLAGAQVERVGQFSPSANITTYMHALSKVSNQSAVRVPFTHYVRLEFTTLR